MEHHKFREEYERGKPETFLTAKHPMHYTEGTEQKHHPHPAKEEVYRADVYTSPEVAMRDGIVAPFFKVGDGQKSTLSQHLTHTDRNTPFVSTTYSMDEALKYLENRMNEKSVKTGYIYVVEPEIGFDARDQAEHRRGRTNAEYAVPGYIKPSEIKKTVTVNRKPYREHYHSKDYYA